MEPARLLCPWDFAGKDTGVGCHALLQGVFPGPGMDPASQVSSTAGGSLPLALPGKKRKECCFKKKGNNKICFKIALQFPLIR